MKKTAVCLILALMIAALAAACAETPPIILFTVYHQVGWGDLLEAGFVDEDGGLWTLSGEAAALGWPGDRAGQLAFLQKSDRLVKAGELDFEALFDLKSLIASVDADEGKPSPAACDAGTEISCAVRYADDAPEIVRLGMSGDDMYENADPDAQALYLWLRKAFPGVHSWFGTEGMGPAGFQPVPLCEFCGLDPAALADAEIRGAYNDCEAGPSALEMDAADAAAVRDRVLNGTITGKASATMTTGGTHTFSFYDAAGNWLGSVEFYRGLLVGRDGMYTIE